MTGQFNAKTKPAWGSPQGWNTPMSNSKSNNKESTGILWGGRSYWQPQGGQNANSWGSPNSWNDQNANSIKVNSGAGFMNNSWGSPTFQNWGGGCSVPVVFESSTSTYNNTWGSPKEASWHQRPENDLKGQQFFEYLKKAGVEDETICILVSEGIHSLWLLRKCTQEALATKGIKLSDVVLLNSL